MPINIACPECGEEYSLDESMAGKLLSCRCGCNIEVAVGTGQEVEAGQKACPKCGNVVVEDAVICVGCGFNFNTGGAVETKTVVTDDDDDGDKVSMYYVVMPFVKIGLFVIALALVGFFFYRCYYVKYYGISDATPLGTYGELDQHFTSIKLEKSSDGAAQEQFGAGAQVFTYRDKILASKFKNMRNEYVSMVVDADGKVLALQGAYLTPGKGVIGFDSKIMRFMKFYWKEIGLNQDLEFTNEKKGSGMFAMEEHAANTSTEKLKAKWVREAGLAGLFQSSDDVFIVLSPYSIKTWRSPPSGNIEDLQEKLKQLNLKTQEDEK